jgi:hypothetical protein
VEVVAVTVAVPGVPVAVVALAEVPVVTRIVAEDVPMVPVVLRVGNLYRKMKVTSNFTMPWACLKCTPMAMVFFEVRKTRTQENGRIHSFPAR